MIDFYEIEFSNEQLGFDDWEPQSQADSDAPGSKLRRRRLSCPSWMAKQRATLFPNKTRIEVCPPKVLGRWNVYGTDDLREAVAETAPLALEELGVAGTPKILKMLAEGKYRVRKVHIAHQFHLRGYSISDYIRKLFRAINESHYPVLLERGTGFFLDAKSRTVQYLFYDKLNEFRKIGVPRYLDRVRALSNATHNHERFALNTDRHFQCAIAACGPRLELRFGDHFFLNSELKHGYNWRPRTADELYQKYLSKLDLPKAVSPIFLRDRARRRLSHQHYKTYLMWAARVELNDAGFTSKTLHQHRLAIKNALNLNIKHSASSVLGRHRSVNPGKVFSWDNRVIAETVDIDSLMDVIYDAGPEYSARR